MDTIKLKKCIKYNKETGEIIWINTISPKNKYRIGKTAGVINNRGYLTIQFNNKPYQAHRLIWWYVYGEEAPSDIDHIDGNRSNNKLSNLRLANKQQNQANARLRRDNSSGYRGIIWNKREQKFIANIRIDGVLHYLGRFDTAIEGHKAYKKAAKKAWGKYAYTGNETTKYEHD